MVARSLVSKGIVYNIWYYTIIKYIVDPSLASKEWSYSNSRMIYSDKCFHFKNSSSVPFENPLLKPFIGNNRHTHRLWKTCDQVASPLICPSWRTLVDIPRSRPKLNHPSSACISQFGWLSYSQFVRYILRPLLTSFIWIIFNAKKRSGIIYQFWCLLFSGISFSCLAYWATRWRFGHW